MTIESSKLSSLKGLEGFPNLEVLSIANSPLLKDFSAIYKLGHKIKRLNVQQPSQELQMFCIQRQIALS
jgi:Leucine-rich repeat (LRR) protein